MTQGEGISMEGYQTMSQDKHSSWLEQAIANANYEGSYFSFVSGNHALSKKHFGLAVPIRLRIAGHHPPEIPRDQSADWLPPYYVIMKGFVTVEIAHLSLTPTICSTIDKLKIFANKLFTALNSPGALVIYSSIEDNEGIPSFFWVYDTQLSIEGEEIDPRDYAKKINEQRNPSEQGEPGKIKKMNSNINDPFQKWTRSLISKQFSFCDVDVLVASNDWKKIYIIELKKSKVKDWMPYLDDAPNYLLFQSIKRLSKEDVDVRDYVIHYDYSDESFLDAYILDKISRKEITGVYKRLESWQAFVGWLEKPTGEPFKSTKSTKRWR